MTKITKRVELAPGGFYEFNVKAPQALSIHAFDANYDLAPGDELHLVVAAPPHPQPKSVALPVPSDERKIA